MLFKVREPFCTFFHSGYSDSDKKGVSDITHFFYFHQSHKKIICAQSNYFREAKEAWEAQSEQVIMEQENAILMFPNPAQTQLNIWFKEELMGEIRITDALGRQVWFERYGTASRSRVIDLSQLSSGLYIMHYRDASKQWTGKFIKNE